MQFIREDEEYARRQLMELLAQIDISADCLDQIYRATIASLKLFTLATSLKPQFRKTHDELRRIWRKCSVSKPIKKDIRALALSMSNEAFDALKRRGVYVFPKLTGFNFERPDFEKWIAKARKQELTSTLMSLVAETTQPVEGYMYKDGSRARKRIEPQILGYVRRGKNSWQPAGGYAHTEASNDLIRNLAADFYGSINVRPFEDPNIERTFKEYLTMVLSWIEMDLPRERLNQLREAVVLERARADK